MVDVLLLLRCILCVPMSTIDGYWLSLGTPTAARGRCAQFVVFLQPSGGALNGCARNRKSFRHMVAGIKPSETYVYYWGQFCFVNSKKSILIPPCKKSIPTVKILG